MVLLIVNAMGILLRFFHLDTYIILAGFRFQLSLFLPILLLFHEVDSFKIKKVFIHPSWNNTFLPIIWLLAPLILVTAALFLFSKINIGDPDYFYELGLSSVVDYPVYLVWNLPQLLMCGLFLIIISNTFNKLPVLKISFITFSLFVYEFIPLYSSKLDYAGIVILISVSLISGLMIKYFQNIYWFAIVMFSMFWISFLSFGSETDAIIHLLFASNYNSWSGFVDIPQSLLKYIIPSYFLLSLLITAFYAFVNNRKI